MKGRRQRKCKGRGRDAQKGLKKEREEDAQSVAGGTERVNDGGVGRARCRQRGAAETRPATDRPTDRREEERHAEEEEEDADCACKDDFSVAHGDFLSLLVFLEFVDANLRTPNGPNTGRYSALSCLLFLTIVFFFTVFIICFEMMCRNYEPDGLRPLGLFLSHNISAGSGAFVKKFQI